MSSQPSVSHRHAPDGLPLPLASCTHVPAVADSVVINEERLHLKRIANSFGQRLFQSQPHRTDVLRKPPHALLKEECCAVSSCMTLRCCMLHVVCCAVACCMLPTWIPVTPSRKCCTLITTFVSALDTCDANERTAELI